ncbi:MAG: oxygenase MpaB family protein [Acidimicrobiales bacterium]
MREKKTETPMGSTNKGSASTSDAVSTEIRRLILNGMALAPAGANVIMQLSQLGVGHGVVESRVVSGSLHRHPIKRTRTTLSYIMIAGFGTPDERAALRTAVNVQHRQVRSLPSDRVRYNAFDPELQLWVAACMYRGVLDSVRFLYGDQQEGVLDEIYRLCGRFATTLQVPDSLWPADRSAFERYWHAALSTVQMDTVTREYLRDFASLGFLPRALHVTLGPAHRFITTGFLAPVFREELGLSWGPWRQVLFDATLKMLATLNRVLPSPLREFPWNFVLRDARRRIALGRPLV